MIKLAFRLFLVSITYFTFSESLAHPGGHGPPQVASCPAETGCTESNIEEAVLRVVGFLSETGQLSPSWKQITTAQSVVRAKDSTNTEMWLATVMNPNETDSTKTAAYFLISKEGYLYDFNSVRPNVQVSGEMSSTTELIAAGVLVLLIGGFFFLYKRKLKKSGN